MIIITLQFTDETALTLATGKNRTEVVKVLLQDTGIDVNLKNQYGKYFFLFNIFSFKHIMNISKIQCTGSISLSVTYIIHI